MTLKKQYIQVADKKDYFLSCNFKWESQACQSLHLQTFLFGSITGCEKSTTITLSLPSHMSGHMQSQVISSHGFILLDCGAVTPQWCNRLQGSCTILPVLF